MKVELTLFGETAILDLPTYAPLEFAIARAFQVCCDNDIYKELTVNGQYDKVELKIVERSVVPQCNELVEKYGLSGLYKANPVLEYFENTSIDELACEVMVNGDPMRVSVNGIIHEWFECTKKDKLHLYEETGSLVDADDVWYLNDLGLGVKA